MLVDVMVSRMPLPEMQLNRGKGIREEEGVGYGWRGQKIVTTAVPVDLKGSSMPASWGCSGEKSG